MEKNYTYRTQNNYHYRFTSFFWRIFYLCTSIYFMASHNTAAKSAFVNQPESNTIRVEVNSSRTGNVLDCAVTEVSLKAEVYINNKLSDEGFSYKWTGLHLSEATTKEITVTKPGNYRLVVNNNNGLIASKDFIVYGPGFPGNYAGPDLKLYPSDVSIQLKGKAYNFYHVNWTATNGGNIVSGANTYSPTVNTPGTYIISLTSPTGCTMMDTMVVSKMESDLEVFISQSAKGIFDCYTKSIELNGVVSYRGNTLFQGVTYEWTGPDGIKSDKKELGATQPGEYKLVVTDTIHKATASSSVTIAPAEYPVGSAGPDKKLTCKNSTVMLEGTMTRGDRVIWLASDGGNIVSGYRTLNPIVDAPGTYTLIINFNITDCQSKYVVKVTRDDELTLNATGGKLDCTNGSAQLMASSDKEGLNYSWSGPNGYTSKLQNPIVKHEGNYTVTASDPETGCATSTMVAVTAPSTELKSESYVIDFNNEKRGLISYIETKAGPVEIMGKKRKFADPSGPIAYAPENHAAIFDSQDPTGDDPDLYTADKGNVLIINQDLTDVPNDNQWGGELILDFSKIGPVTMESVEVIDIDTYEPNSWIHLYDKEGDELNRFLLKNIGNNSKQTVNLGNTRGVMKMVVVLDGRNGQGQLAGSGAIDDIMFRVESEVVRPCKVASQEGALQAIAYPTAFSDQANVQFKLLETSNYTVNLYDAHGTHIRTLSTGTAMANQEVSVQVPADNLKDGMYLVNISSPVESKTLKLILKR